jgi:hypothetical protein|tara:strand:- start:362 stop:706 length:345 start_codon:yes stop_codon:yes gene_type:complete
MSIKIALLKSGESVIADIIERGQEKLISGEKKINEYLFNKPYAVNFAPTYGFLSEESSEKSETEDDKFNISFSPWIPFTMDEEMLVKPDWVVTVVNPAVEIVKLYEELIDGQSS